MNRQSASRLAGSWVVDPFNKVVNPNAKRRERTAANNAAVQNENKIPVENDAYARSDESSRNRAATNGRGAESLPKYGQHVNFARFSALWSRVAVGGGNAVRVQNIYRNLLRRYDETHRRYHTAAHIEHCLSQVDLGRQQNLPDADLVELAIWFHDAVYETKARDNEWQSVELFRKWASDVIDENIIDSIERLIMVTVHDRPPVAADEKFIVDVDLSSFGLPWSDFWRDSTAVRLEQLHLDDSTYNNMQRRFLVRLLDRKSIFSSRCFRQRYESQARSNIRAYLAQLLMNQGHASSYSV